MLLVDPALEEYITEQQNVIDSLEGPLPPPLDPAVFLPAETLVLPGYPHCTIRIIRPVEKIKGVYLHIHGGGFQFGSAENSDASNSMLANRCGLATVSVDYRLAPVHSHPAQVSDCVAAAHWLIDSASSYFGTDSLFVGGESVGATLAVLTLLRLRSEGGLQKAFRGANLIVGNYDFSMTPSQCAARANHFLSPQVLSGIREAAFPGKDLNTLRYPTISPLYANLSDMPAAIFSVGTDDSVVDDSLFMAQRWVAAGNKAQLEVYPGAPHLFMGYSTLMAEEAHRRIGRFLEKLCY